MRYCLNDGTLLIDNTSLSDPQAATLIINQRAEDQTLKGILSTHKRRLPSWLSNRIMAVILINTIIVGIITAVIMSRWNSFNSNPGSNSPSARPSIKGPPSNAVSLPPVCPKPEIVVSKRSSRRPSLIAIPGGTYQMGRDNGPSEEAPAHSVTVSDFSIDKTEVSNTEYADFIRDMRWRPPSYWVGDKPLANQERWPVNEVSICDAVVFAAWRSKRDGVTYRLPTEEEWEYVARNGDQANLYPWGNIWADDSAVVSMISPQAVGSFPGGKNKWGVLDLIGNVWEWTSSRASIYPGARLAIPEQDKEAYVMRGGSYASKPTGVRAITATFRDWIPGSTKHTTLGFRLVRTSP